MNSILPLKALAFPSLLSFFIAVGVASAQTETASEPEIDVAKLTPEKLAEQFSVEWTSVSSTAQRNLKPSQTSRSINISGEITLINEEHILLLSSSAEISEAVDDTGRVLVGAGQQGEAQR